MTTIKQALETGYAQLANEDSGRLETEILLALALKKDRTFLYTWPDHILSAEQNQHFLACIERRRQGQPIAYIMGSREFWGLKFTVTPATLIPRPETERLVEIALQTLNADKTQQVVDLGTGSGAIALALASERSNWHVTATDISEAALDIARQNAKRLNIENVAFVHSQWFQNLDNAKFDLIISNPPYVAKDDPHLRQGDLRFEPIQALSAGVDGLDAIREIITGSAGFLQSGGWLLLEHGFDQGVAVCQLLSDQGFAKVQCFQDYGHRERASIGQWNGSA